MSRPLDEQYATSAKLDARIRLHDRFSTNSYGWFRWLFDRLTLPSGSRILELGTGTAKLWIENGERIPQDWEIVLSDLSPGMLDEAKQGLTSVPHDFDFAVIDAQAIPYDDARFDAILANFMLYHVRDKPKAFSEIRRVLVPGGRLFAATTGEAHLRELVGFIRRIDPAWSLSVADAGGFSLEDGMAQLEPWFADITLVRYPDGLIITEVDPIIRYILSTDARAAMTNEKLKFLVLDLSARIEADGAVHVSKDSGVFVARRSASHS